MLLGQSIKDLGQLAQDSGQSAYRGKQLYDGLLHGVRHIDQFNQVCLCFCIQSKLHAHGAMIDIEITCSAGVLCQYSKHLGLGLCFCMQLLIVLVRARH